MRFNSYLSVRSQVYRLMHRCRSVFILMFLYMNSVCSGRGLAASVGSIRHQLLCLRQIGWGGGGGGGISIKTARIAGRFYPFVWLTTLFISGRSGWLTFWALLAHQQTRRNLIGSCLGSERPWHKVLGADHALISSCVFIWPTGMANGGLRRSAFNFFNNTT